MALLLLSCPGVTMREVMWSHIIIQTFMMILQTIIVLVGFLEILKVTNDGPLFWVVLLCMLQGFCGMCLGKPKTPLCAFCPKPFKITLSCLPSRHAGVQSDELGPRCDFRRVGVLLPIDRAQW